VTDNRRQRHRAYLGVTVAFGLMIAGLAWEGPGRFLFDPERLLWELPEHMPAPELDVELTATATGGIAVRLITTNYRFVNYCAANDETQSVAEGHAHLYLDGRKLQSLYAPYAEIEAPPPGEHSLSVSLNVLPDHRVVSLNGQPLMVERTVTVSDERFTVQPTASKTAHPLP